MSRETSHFVSGNMNFAKLLAVFWFLQLCWAVKVMGDSRTRCQKMRSESFKKTGSFTPKCNSDGSFAKRQCNFTISMIHCWKVYRNGTKTGARETFIHLGTGSRRTTPSPATTISTPKPVNRVLTKCEKLHKRKSERIPKPSFIPECTKDGCFKKEQCSVNRKKCWCVNTGGKRIPGTKVHNGKPNCNEEVCGKRFQSPPSRRRRVVGGQEAASNTWPWQALVIYTDPKQICGGTLVKRNWIVTSASCFDGFSRKKDDWSVRLGAHRLQSSLEATDQMKVKAIHIHPKYKPGNKTHPGDYDVALLQVYSSSSVFKNVRPLCLPGDISFYKRGARCSITGWGHTSYNGTRATALREAWVDLVVLNECNSKKSYNGVINDRFMCAGFKEGGIDACHFDTGGPLACPVRGGVWALAGIISWRQKCGEPYKYGVYTNVHVVKPWIDQTIRC